MLSRAFSILSKFVQVCNESVLDWRLAGLLGRLFRGGGAGTRDLVAVGLDEFCDGFSEIESHESDDCENGGIDLSSRNFHDFVGGVGVEGERGQDGWLIRREGDFPCGFVQVDGVESLV